MLNRTLLLAGLALSGFALPALAQSKAFLPTVTSYSLDRAKVTLPDDLAGAQNVLILYYKPDQSEAAIAWATALQPVEYAHPGLETYVLPVYPKENFLYRWWIEASLRSSAPPAQEWRYTVPLFVDKTSFFSALGIHSERLFTVLLTDKQGHVEWRSEGSMDEGKMTALGAALNRAGNPARSRNQDDPRAKAHPMGR